LINILKYLIMNNKVSKEEMERESILKTKEGLYNLGVEKTKRDIKNEKELIKFKKSHKYIYEKNGLNEDNAYEKIIKYSNLEWNNMYINFQITNMFSNKNNILFTNFYYLLDYKIIF
jgi:hypothetical protein